MTIKIKEIEVSGFGNIKKIANELNITSAIVNLPDDGATITYHLTGNGEVVHNNGLLKIVNEDLLEWINTDAQLVNIILKKLGLEHAEG